MKTANGSILACVALAIFTTSTTVAQTEDYLYETNNGTITIAFYTGPGGAVIIPGEVYGLPVRTIGEEAFAYRANLVSVTIPDSVTCIQATRGGALGAFTGCSNLTNVTIGNSVTDIGRNAFGECTSLTGVYFEGNAPSAYSGGVFNYSTNVTVYYLPGRTGWETTFAGRPTAQWLLPYPTILTAALNFGVQTNAFGFRVSWATNMPVVVEASTDLPNPVWSPVSTNALVGGWSDFRDAEWTNYPARFYRVRQW